MPDAFVARQPIFNPKLEVVGYELLFRGEGYVNDVAMIANPESATATVVLNALTELDLGRIVGTRTAWVNISREFVTGGLAHALPSDLVGLEIPETEQFDDEMLAALRELKSRATSSRSTTSATARGQSRCSSCSTSSSSTSTSSGASSSPISSSG